MYLGHLDEKIAYMFIFLSTIGTALIGPCYLTPKNYSTARLQKALTFEKK